MKIPVQVQEIIDHKDIGIGGMHRQNCPFCGGNNTFSVARTLTSVMWNCFRNTCKSSGTVETEIPKEAMTPEKLKELLVQADNDQPHPMFDLSDVWLPASSSLPTQKFLKANKSWTAYTEKRIDVRFDPKENRHVFVSYKDGKPVGAYGRANDPTLKPKWYNYNSQIIYPFVVPKSGTAQNPKTDYPDGRVGVLVEDVLSATVVSAYADGIALLGTTLLENYIPLLHEYDEVVICLDKDASEKAGEIARLVNFWVTCAWTITDYDPKNLETSQLDRLFSSYI